MTPTSLSVHDRILSAAYPLFAQRGIRQITIEEVQRVAGITGSEFDQEFSSRDDLATECLEKREREWTAGIVETGARAGGTTAEGRLLAIFDVFSKWFHRDGYEALTCVDALSQMCDKHPLGHANVAYLLAIRRLAAALAVKAHLRDPAEFSLSWHVLITGSIINAVGGDERAAGRAKEMGRDLIKRHRPRLVAAPVPESDIFDFDFDTFDFDSFNFALDRYDSDIPIE